MLLGFKKKGLGLIVLCSMSLTSFACHHPSATMAFMSAAPTKVYVGETIKVPIRMDYSDLLGQQWWELPPDVSIEYVSGQCPPPEWFDAFLGNGTCIFNAKVYGRTVGDTITQYFSYHSKHARDWFCSRWNKTFYSPAWRITVIPHPMSMGQIEIQDGTARLPFNMPMKPHVDYFYENVQAGNKPEVVVTPLEQDGLKYDSVKQSISGVPTRMGAYQFDVSMKSTQGVSTSTHLSLDIKPNEKDKPMFKSNVPHVSIVANNPFHFNLLNLLKPVNSFMVTNQVRFKLTGANQDGVTLHINEDNEIMLEGIIKDKPDVGELFLTITAISNTGGESEPYQWRLPVIHHQNLKPEILEGVIFEVNAGSTLNYDLTPIIKDPTADPLLSIAVEHSTPIASWLSVSTDNLRTLSGDIPESARGKTYELTLSASNHKGGMSTPVKVIMKVA